MTYVVAGGIVRNRGWILGDSIRGIERNAADRLFYLTGDNEDDTETVLKQFSETTDYEVYNTGAPYGTRDGKQGGTERYNSQLMGQLRNVWLHKATQKYPQATHFWVVDSDVIPGDGVLGGLLALRADVAAPYVPVNKDGLQNYMIGWDPENRRPKRTGEERNLSRPHVVSCVGCSYLISKKVAEHVFLWGQHAMGEDGFFANKMRQLGYIMVAHPVLGCKHIMNKEEAL